MTDVQKWVPDILGADPMAAALLIECRGRDAAALQVGHYLVLYCYNTLL